MYTYDLTSDCDFIIMGCDGCWETKSNEEMVAWVYEKLEQAPDRSIQSLKDIVSALLNELVSPNHTQTQGVGCDNMTCVLIVFKSEK